MGTTEEGLTLDQIAELFGETKPALLRVAAKKFGHILALAMGFPDARVLVEIVELAPMHKVGMRVGFAPPLSAREREEYEALMPLLCMAMGSAPPVKAPIA